MPVFWSGSDRPRASENFYRNFFALLTFLTFLFAIATNSAVAFVVTLIFATLSRVAIRKGWRNPVRKAERRG